jgi:hypothetical protein
LRKDVHLSFFNFDFLFHPSVPGLLTNCFVSDSTFSVLLSMENATICLCFPPYKDLTALSMYFRSLFSLSCASILSSSFSTRYLFFLLDSDQEQKPLLQIPNGW